MDMVFDTSRLFKSTAHFIEPNFVVSDDCIYRNITDYTLEIENNGRHATLEFDGLLATNASIRMSESGREEFLDSDIWRRPGDVTVGYMADIGSIIKFHKFIDSILNKNSTLMTPWLVIIDLPAKYFAALRNGLLVMNRAGLHGIIIETDRHMNRLCHSVLNDPFCIQLRHSLTN